MSFNELVGNAILGIDTLWGGDVLCPSGAGRFIADSWFSDEPMPIAYTHPMAKRIRETGGVSAKQPDKPAIRAYLSDVDVSAAIAALKREAAAAETTLRGQYLSGLALCFEVMWDIAMERIGMGDPVPYPRAVIASTGRPPEASQPERKCAQVAALLAERGFPSQNRNELLYQVDAWRRAHASPMASIRSLGAAAIAYFDQLTVRNLVPHLPPALRPVPRANIEFLSIRDAWFSGSMNYLGRQRNPDGSPQYEATYEINASLQISYPEFLQLVSHEVAPGHVTTFAYLQNLYFRKAAGFEASVLTMNTRAATLFEGIANNAILIAHGALEIEELPDPDMKIGVLLALLQDDAKNQASYMTWGEGATQAQVDACLRADFLVSAERADKLSGAWGRHPLLGRMYLPAYRAGTEKVAHLRRLHPPEKLLPVLYGCAGLVDIVTIGAALT